MGIFLNYGGAGSHHGGAGRITPTRQAGWPMDLSFSNIKMITF